MQSLKDQITKAEDKVKCLKRIYSQVMVKLKEEARGYNADHMGEVSRRVMCYYFGEYFPYYDSYARWNGSTISKGQKWSNEGSKGEFVSTGAYSIHNKSGSYVGFICRREDILNIMRYEDLLKVWFFKKYRNS